MAWRIEDSPDVTTDLDRLYEHLIASHIGFDEPLARAIELAEARVDAVFDSRLRLLVAPHRGTLHHYRGRQYRHVTIDRAIYWFTLDKAREIVRVIGIFQSGQDHLDRMLARLAEQGEADR